MAGGSVSELVEFVEFMLILALLVIVFLVFLACVLLIDHYVKQFVGLMDSAINVSRPSTGWVRYG